MRQLTPSVKWRTRKAFVLHYFNKMRVGVWTARSGDELVIMEREQPIYEIMSENCPYTEKALLRAMLGGSY